jgi:TetR/AcrR family transcriptional repressor of nem operon
VTKDTKANLLDAAETAARARGFDGFSYADLAASVGIRTASIHYHFPAKADLALELMQRYSRVMETDLTEIAAKSATGAERLRHLAGHYRAALNGGQAVCLCVAFSTTRDSLTEPVIAAMKAFRKMLTNWLTEAFALGSRDGSITAVGQLATEAAATLALVEGAHLIARAEKDVQGFDAAMAGLLARLDGMNHPPSLRKSVAS